MTSGGRGTEGQARRTHPLGAILHFGRIIGKTAVPLVAAVIGSGMHRNGGLWLVLAVLVAAAVPMLISWAAWRRRTYKVGEEDIRVDSGLIARTARSVPFERIQDVSLEQKLMARLLGLVEVRFETGAGGKDELVLAYVSTAEGNRLREVVRERREGARQLAEASPVPSETPPLFSMDARRLAIFGVFEFSLAVFAVLMGAAQQFDFLLPLGTWDWTFWARLAEGQGADMLHWGYLAQSLLAIAGILGLILLGLATGLVTTVSREYGFRLDRTERGFRRRRGLFTVTDVVMPAHRVQAIEISTRWLRYRFNWFALKFVSLAQDAKSASHVVAPFAQPEEIWPIAREVGLMPPSDEIRWIRPSRKAWSDRALLWSLPFLAAAASAAISAPSVLYGILPLLALPFVALLHWRGWRRQAHAVEGAQAFLRQGLLSPQLKVAQLVRFQSAEIRQGPIARLRGYAALDLGLAGGSFTISKIDLPEARRLRSSVLASISGVDFSQLERQSGRQQILPPQSSALVT